MSSIEKNITPFLRWAGGKKWLVKYLLSIIPNDVNNYYEPFLGAGNLFFKMNGQAKKYFLSDLNKELILTYNQVKNNVEDVIAFLQKFRNSEKEYLMVRQKVYDSPIKNAAKFIYLNKTSFNGIYRVNSKGEYNVPFGYRTGIDVVEGDKLKKISLLLKKATIKNQDFEAALNNCGKKDLVYIDPPYTVAHENNGFIMYNAKIFSWEDQERLSKLIHKLSKKGCFVILSNAYHPSVKKLYKGFVKVKLSRNSTIAGMTDGRKYIHEYLIKNF